MWTEDQHKEDANKDELFKHYLLEKASQNHIFIGKRLYDLKDTNGKLFVRDIRKNARNGGGFTTYTFTQVKSDGSSKIAEKLVYSNLIPNTDDILIATGVYIR